MVVAAVLRVGERQVRTWRQAWRDGGSDALRSKGPHSVERLSPAQWERLVRELELGPMAHGWSEDQCWTLGRIRGARRCRGRGLEDRGLATIKRTAAARDAWISASPTRQARA